MIEYCGCLPSLQRLFTGAELSFTELIYFITFAQPRGLIQ